MLERFHQFCDEFKDDCPGVRFQRLHQRRMAAQRTLASRAACLGTGVGISGLGLLMLVAPGPGLLVLAVGAGLIAQESRLVAKSADWIEVRLRCAGNAAFRLWRGLPRALQGAIVALGLAMLAGAGFAGYLLMVALW